VRVGPIYYGSNHPAPFSGISMDSSYTLLLTHTLGRVNGAFFLLSFCPFSLPSPPEPSSGCLSPSSLPPPPSATPTPTLLIALTPSGFKLVPPHFYNPHVSYGVYISHLPPSKHSILHYRLSSIISPCYSGSVDRLIEFIPFTPASSTALTFTLCTSTQTNHHHDSFNP